MTRTEMANANRASTIFYYPHAGPAITAQWRDGSSDAPKDAVWLSEDAQINKTMSSAGTKLLVDVRLEIDREAVEGVIESGEDLAASTELRILVSSDGTQSARRRESFVAVPDPDDESGTQFIGSWELERSKLGGNLAFEPSLVRLTKGSDPALASFPGEELANSDGMLTLIVKERDSEVGGDIDVTWANFPEARRGDVGKAWVLEATYNSATPKLFLDETAKGFHATLTSDTDPNPQRDLLLATIASEVWTSLASSALAALARAETGEGDDAESGIGLADDDWRRRLLIEVAAFLYEDQEVDEGIQSLLAAQKVDALALGVRITSAAQLRNKTRKALEAVIANSGKAAS